MKTPTLKPLTQFLRAAASRNGRKLLVFGLCIPGLMVDPLPAGATFRTWTGAASGFWSNPNNWSPFGAPETGDFLTFATDNHTTMTNDLLNLAIAGMNFVEHEYVLEGNLLRVGEGVPRLVEVSEITASATINCPLTLSGWVEFDVYEFFGVLWLNGDINLNGHPMTLHAGIGSIYVAGAISGEGHVETTPMSNGYIKFLGTSDNTFTGTFIANGGSTIHFDKQAGSAVASRLELWKGVTIHIDSPHQIGNNATVCVADGSQLLFHGNTETIGNLCLTNKTGSTNASLVDTGGSTLSVLGDITSENHAAGVVPTIRGLLGLPPGMHAIHTDGAEESSGLNIEAAIIGDGGFTKTGSSGLLLGGDSSFDGDAVLQEGHIEVSHAKAFGSSSGETILSGGHLHVRQTAIGTETLRVNQADTGSSSLPGAVLVAYGVSSWAGAVVLHTNLMVVGDEVMTMEFFGPVLGPGGMTFMGDGTNRLSGAAANTYTGPTVVRSSLLELNKSSGAPAFGGPLIVGDGDSSLNEVRWLQNYQRVYADVTILADGLVNLNNHAEDFGPITFNGGTIDTGSTGEVGIYGLVMVNAANTEATIQGRMGLPPGAHEFRVGDGPPLQDLMVNARVVGSGELRKTGPGQMWLTASNDYSGLTTVEGGSLVAFHADALGASGTGTIVGSGASLILNAPNSIVHEPILIGGPGDGAHGALNVFGSVTLRNPFPDTFACLELIAPSTIRVEPGGVLTADGIVKGVGPLTKTGPGQLIFTDVTPNSYSGDTVVEEGVLSLSKPSFAISVPGNLIVGPAPVSSSAMARWSTSGGMNPGATATINARSLLDLNGNGLTLSRLNLNDGGDAQTGAGKLTFGLGGMVAVGSLDQAGAHSSSFVSGNLGLPANATLTFLVNAYAPTPPFNFNPELDVSAAIAAPAENPLFERAGIAKTGPGTMRLFGNTSFNGRVDVLDGTFLAGNATALGSAFDGTFVQNNARLVLEGSSTFAGESLVLNSTATPALENVSAENWWSGPVLMNRDSVIGTRAASSLHLDGIISGTANLTKVGPGTLSFGGGNNNTYNGQTFINEGTLLLSKPLAVTAVPGVLNIGSTAGLPATVANLTSYQVVGNIIVNRGGLLNVLDQVENVDHLTLREGGDVQTTTGVLSLKTGGSIQVLPGAVNDRSTISGNLEMLAGGHSINVAASTGPATGPELDVTALVTSSGGLITMQKTGSGKLRLGADNTYSGSVIVGAGNLQLDGSQPASGVLLVGDARLIGNGRVGSVALLSPSAVVAPGASPGRLQVGDLNLYGMSGGILNLELNGTVAGSQYDQLNVQGIVDLNTLTLQAGVNFAPTTGAEFMIINNDLIDPVEGTFNGLPQDATVTLGDHIFQIDYTGGDGNDVVLTKTADVYRPVLTIQSVAPASVRLLWPTNDPTFILQSTTNLSSTNLGAWTAVPEMPVDSGTNRVVTNAVSGAPRLYRLIKP